MEKKSNGKTIALIVLGVLTAFGLTLEILSYIHYYQDEYTSGSYFPMIVYGISSLLLMYYAFAGYKKPHGNLLKYLFIVFAICCLSDVVSVKAERVLADDIYNYTRGIVVLMAGYVAGRLNRYKQNIVLMSIIGVLMLISSLAMVTICTELISTLDCFTFFVLWVDLMIAYILRYKEHKEAGLADK